MCAREQVGVAGAVVQERLDEVGDRAPRQLGALLVARMQGDLGRDRGAQPAPPQERRRQLLAGFVDLHEAHVPPSPPGVGAGQSDWSTSSSRGPRSAPSHPTVQCAHSGTSPRRNGRPRAARISRGVRATSVR